MREIVIRLSVPDDVEVRIEDVPAEVVQHEPAFRTIATDAPRPTWQVGQIHAQGHNALKSNARGLFCPTKIDGVWCAWRP